MELEGMSTPDYHKGPAWARLLSPGPLVPPKVEALAVPGPGTQLCHRPLSPSPAPSALELGPCGHVADIKEMQA